MARPQNGVKCGDPAPALIWSDPVNSCETVGLSLSWLLLLPWFEDGASSSRGRF